MTENNFALTIILLSALLPAFAMGGFSMVSKPANPLEKNRQIEYKMNSLGGGASGSPFRPLSPTKLKLQAMFLPKTTTTTTISTTNNSDNDNVAVKSENEEENMNRFVSVLRHKKELKLDEADKSFETDDTVLEDDAVEDYGDHDIEEEQEQEEQEKVTGSGHRSKRSLWDWLFGYDGYHHHHHGGGGHYSRRWWPARRQHHRHWRSW